MSLCPLSWALSVPPSEIAHLMAPPRSSLSIPPVLSVILFAGHPDAHLHPAAVALRLPSPPPRPPSCQLCPCLRACSPCLFPPHTSFLCSTPSRDRPSLSLPRSLLRSESVSHPVSSSPGSRLILLLQLFLHVATILRTRLPVAGWPVLLWFWA